MMKIRWLKLTKNNDKDKVRFLTDKMYLKLTKRLRMMGFDAKINSDMPDYPFIKIAMEENRILITRDEDLKNRALKKDVQSITVEGETIEERLAHLINELNLTIDFEELPTPRCTICNSKINSVKKTELTGIVGEGTLEHYDEFWRCSNETCNKVYWKGSHWDKLKISNTKVQNLIKSTIQKN